jgi:tRNA-splicing ligase RtcB (3'-phosphate/5'-hydroxy nucleic acid ligase)
MNDINPIQIHATGEATGFIPAPGDKAKPITVIGTNSIRAGFDATCLQQALNDKSVSGVTDLVLNPDVHSGYGAPVGCVAVSPILCVLASWRLCVNPFAVLKLK